MPNLSFALYSREASRVGAQPVRLLGAYHRTPRIESLTFACPPASDIRPKDDEDVVGSNLASILPAMSGSCALLTYIDTASEDMYVALAGDCRAVAGYWMEKEQKWRVDVLSEDQTGRNPKELAR